MTRARLATIVLTGGLAGLAVGLVSAAAERLAFVAWPRFLGLAALLGLLASCGLTLLLAVTPRLSRRIARVYSPTPRGESLGARTLTGASLLTLAQANVVVEIAGRPGVQALVPPPWTLMSLFALLLVAMVGVTILLLRRWPRSTAGGLLLFVAMLLGAFVVARQAGLGPMPLLRLALFCWLAGLAAHGLARLAVLRRAPLVPALALLVAAGCGAAFGPDPAATATRTDGFSNALVRWLPAPERPPPSFGEAALARWFGRTPSGRGEDLDRAYPERRSWNVLWITVCTLRRDRVGAYGGKRGLTPNIDRLAKHSAVFTRAYTPFPASAYAMDAMFSGRYPFQTNRFRKKLELAPVGDEPWFPRFLRDRGWITWGLTSLNRLMLAGDFAGLLDGFDVANPYTHHVGARGPRIVRAFDQLLSRHDPKRRFFAWIQVMDPHAPYQGDPEGPSLGTRPVDRYDASVRATDRNVGRLLDRLKKSGLSDRTVVVFTADHGEEFGEHGGFRHHTSVYDEQVAVPLIIHHPGMKPQRIEAPVDLCDLPPTLAELLGSDERWSGLGDSIVPLLLGEPMDSVAYTEVLYPRRPEAERRALIGPDGRKLIHRGPRPYRELYDLVADPRETANLLERGGRAPELDALLARLSEVRPDESVAFPALPTGPAKKEGEGEEGSAAMLRQALAQDDLPKAHLLTALKAVFLVNDTESAKLAMTRSDHPDPEVRHLVLRIIAAFKLSDALPRVRALLADPESRVRVKAISTLGSLGSRADLPALADDPRLSADERLERGIARSRLGDSASLASIRSLLPQLPAGQRGRLLVALATEGDEEAEDLLRAALENRPDEIHLAAISFLIDRRDVTAERRLVRHVRESSLPVPILVQAMERFEHLTPSREAVLLEALDHADPGLRREALRREFYFRPREKIVELHRAWQIWRDAQDDAARDEARAALSEAKIDLVAGRAPELTRPAPEVTVTRHQAPRRALASAMATALRLSIRSGATARVALVARFRRGEESLPPGPAATVDLSAGEDAEIVLALPPVTPPPTAVEVGVSLPEGGVRWLGGPLPLR